MKKKCIIAGIIGLVLGVVGFIVYKVRKDEKDFSALFNDKDDYLFFEDVEEDETGEGEDFTSDMEEDDE